MAIPNQKPQVFALRTRQAKSNSQPMAIPKQKPQVKRVKIRSPLLFACKKFKNR
jgi:hypothetical protein